MRLFLMATVIAGGAVLGLGATAPAEAAPHGLSLNLASVQAEQGAQPQAEQVQYRRYHRRPHRRYHRRGRY